jgi:DNA-binding IclR family transcriptional regulator
MAKKRKPTPDIDTDAGSDRRSTNIATVRVLHVLNAFALDKPQFGVTELSQRLGLTKNMVHRALVTLVNEGFLIRDPGGVRYELGFGVLELQNQNFPVPDFRTLARTAQDQLHALTGATTQLSIRVGDNQVVIDGVEAFGPTATRPKIGSFFPLHASAASRAILAFLSDTEVEDYLRRNAPLRRFTETTLVMPEEIRDEVQRVRASGYAKTLGDYHRSGRGFSFPVLGLDGHVHGAITVGAPESLWSEADAERQLPRMLRIIENLRRECALYDAR